jgi:hypothetical protein
MVQMYNIIDNAIRLDKNNLKIVIKKSINLQKI